MSPKVQSQDVTPSANSEILAVSRDTLPRHYMPLLSNVAFPYLEGLTQKTESVYSPTARSSFVVTSRGSPKHGKKEG